MPAPLKDSDFRIYPEAQVELGRRLFYDRVLSGTYRVSCATCHHHDRASSNGFLLEGRREATVDQLADDGLSAYDAAKPSNRHAPALFNLGAKEFTTLFSDGRVARTKNGAFLSPAETELPFGLNDVLAVQALFPAVTGDELVGTLDTDLRGVAGDGHTAIWEALAARIRDLPDYAPMFEAAYPEQSFEEITMADVAHAIGAFVGAEWRADASPFDAYLKGDDGALNVSARRGLSLFYGDAKCATCHRGPFLTDHHFHGTGLPVWRFDETFKTEDFVPLEGRSAVSGNAKQRYHFRTPGLRNVEYTAPYGWAGSYRTLDDFLRAHADPRRAVIDFVAERVSGRPSEAVRRVMADLQTNRTQDAVVLDDGAIADLVAFLHALSDERGVQGRFGKPNDVPSGLALD